MQTLSPLTPAMKPSLRFWAGRWTGAGLAALLLAACFPPFDLPILLPVALVTLFWQIEGVTARQANYIGLLFGFVFYALTLRWLTNMFQQGALGLWIICAAFPALFCGLTVWLRSRLPRVPAWLIAAVVWTGIEYFRSEPMKPNFAWMGLGYALVNRPGLAWLASVFGVYGLSFLLVAGSGYTWDAWRAGSENWQAGIRRRFAFPILWLTLYALPLAPPPLRHPLTARLVQADSEDDESLFRLSTQPNGPRPDIIVWPEYSFVHDVPRDAPLWQKLVRVPQENHCYFLFGGKADSDPQDEATFHNTAFLLAPTGQVIHRHVKNHPVPFIRDGQAGMEAKAVDTSIGRLGVGICFDFDFPDVARRLTADGAQILLAPSDNPREWGALQHRQHEQMFQMRAIECGRWLAVDDVAGSTFVVAPTGKITARVSDAEPTALNARLDRSDNQTLYVRGGWRFGQICLAFLLALVAFALRPAKRPIETLTSDTTGETSS